MLTLLQARWVDAFLGSIPYEGRSDCSQCNMLVPESGRLYYFHSQTKCCTYFPRLPNFLVGEIFEHEPEGSEGLLRLRNYFEQQQLTPLGLSVPQKYQQQFNNKNNKIFGQNPDFRCPFYLVNKGGCSIWRYRCGVCATWFCRHERGKTADVFWFSLSELLAELERELAIWCISEMGLDFSVILSLSNALSGNYGMCGVGDSDSYRKMWGIWTDRELMFFRTCGQAVSKLTWKKILEQIGPSVSDQISQVRNKFKELTCNRLPLRLKRGQVYIESQGPSSVFVMTYNPYDPLELSLFIYEILKFFDGRLTEDIRQEIFQLTGVEIMDEVLWLLIDFEVLVEVS